MNAKRLLHILSGLLLLGILAGCVPAEPPPAADEILLHPQETYQVLEGFGASGAWWAQAVGGWEEDKRQRVIQLLFDPQAGIGLSVYRYNIGGGGTSGISDDWRRAESFEVSPGVYDWSRDANAVWVLKAAHRAGVQRFVAFANSPPASLTVSGASAGAEGGKTNLKPGQEAAFARYLVDVTRHLRQDEGVPVGWISPLNEPQWDWQPSKGQEGSHYEPAEVLALTKALLQAIQDSGLDVKASLFESGEWKSSRPYIDVLLKDPAVARALGPLSIHSYWSSPADRTALVAYLQQAYPGTQIWMSEWTEMKSGQDTGMDSALVLAGTLHADLVLGGVTSWQYWIAVSKYDYRDGLIYVNLAGHRITETKRLWAFGNYSRYLRPGFTRLGAASGAPDLLVSAYRSPDASSLVLVAVNNAAAPRDLRLRGLPGEYRAVRQVETSSAADLQETFSGPPAQRYTFPAQSVTTLIFQK